MAEPRTYRLPDVGEGLTEAEIVSWKVKPGDAVAVNDVLCEIETAKSVVELPSPYAGTVGELLAREGQTLDVGTPLVHMAPEGAADTATDTAADAGSSDSGGSDSGSGGVLVGYGPRAASTPRRSRRRAGPPAADHGTVAADQGVATAPRALAKPPVRKLAKDLGVELAGVSPTGPGGTITRDDVTARAEQEHHRTVEPGGIGGAGDRQARTAGGGETRVPIRGVRKRTAEAMVGSAFTAPHVTEWVTLDASAAVELVERLKGEREFRELKVSPLLVIAKACLLAVRRTPEANATWDGDAGEIVLHHDVHLGIAAATPRGLVVPNVKGADRMALPDLCRALGELTATAREGTTPPADMQGGTFTITNVGVFGVDAGTPILNPGESAILAVGAIRRKPWVVAEQVVPRWVLTLAVSFDHRIVDGEQGSRFLADVSSLVEDPSRALLYA